MKRLLVCGSRYAYSRFIMDVSIESVIYALHWPMPITIIHGGARGADTMAGLWAVENNCPVEVYPADWDRYGRSAGYIRNNQMLTEGKPDAVLAIFVSTAENKGTQMMCDIAHKAGIPVYTEEEPGDQEVTEQHYEGL